MIRRFKGTLLPIILVALISGPATSQTRSAPTPKLVVFITIDALRADYLPRFEKQLTGGLGRLYKGGAVFTNAFQDHAITETAPGHATTLSGRFPVHTGILANTAGVNDTTVSLVDAVGESEHQPGLSRAVGAVGAVGLSKGTGSSTRGQDLRTRAARYRE